MARSIKVEALDGRIATSGAKRFYVPYPHALPKVGGEVSSDILQAIGPRKTSVVPPNVNVGLLPEKPKSAAEASR